jgi:THO complex subunit 4
MRITSASIISAVSNAPSNSNPRRGGNVRGGNSGRRDNNNSGARRGGNNKRESRPKPSQQDLDAEMDSYMGGTNEDIQMN